MERDSYIKSASILAIGALLSRFIGLFYKSLITKILGSYAIGLYYNTFYIFSFLLSFIIAAVPLSISKMTAERSVMGMDKNIKKMMLVLFTFLILVGVLMTYILVFHSRDIITLAKWDEDTYYPLIGLSLAPIIIVCICIIRGYFQGINFMKPTAVSQIIESLSRLVIGVPLCYYLTITYKGSIGAGGATLGTTISEGVSLVILYYYYLHYKKRKSPGDNLLTSTESSLSIIKRFFQIAIPVSVSSVIISIYGIINSFTYPSSLLKAGISLEEATQIFGDYSNANTLANIPLTFSMAISMAIIPLITQYFVKGDYKNIALKIRVAIRLVLITGLPCVIGLAILSDKAFGIIFNQSIYGGELLKWNSYSVLLIMFSMIFQSILQGLDSFHIPIRNLAIGLIIKVVLNITLMPIPEINIYGMIISNVVSFGILTILNFTALYKLTHFKLKVADVILPVLTSSIMGLFVILLKNILDNYLHDILTVIVVSLLGVIVYFVLLVVTGAIKEEDFNNIPRGKFLKGFYDKLK